MASAVLDASVLLAHIRREAGSQGVAEIAPDALMSTVNLAEVISKLTEEGLGLEHIDQIIYRYGFEVVPYDEELARDTGALRLLTKKLGLSLGDRACLALAQRERLPALTTDKQWGKLSIGVEVRVIR